MMTADTTIGHINAQTVDALWTIQQGSAPIAENREKRLRKRMTLEIMR